MSPQRWGTLEFDFWAPVPTTQNFSMLESSSKVHQSHLSAAPLVMTVALHVKKVVSVSAKYVKANGRKMQEGKNDVL